MTVEIVAVVLAGAAAGGFINGLAGFGTALVALGIWLQVMPPWQAVTIAAAMSVVSGVQGMWLIRKNLSIGIRRLPRFLLPALIGIPIGTASLHLINATVVKLVIAGFILLYGAFFLLRGALPRIRHEMPAVDILIGFAGGVLGGAAALSGALPTMWCAMHDWTKGETSAVLRPYNVVILAVATAVFAAQGYFAGDTLILVGIALPATLIASQIGVAIFHRLTDRQFRWLLVWLLLGTGMLVAARELATLY